MSHKQENLIDNRTSTSKVKNSLSSKFITDTENSKPFAADPRSDGNLKLISPTKSKFFMPKPRISSHCKGEPMVVNSKLQVKSLVDFQHFSSPKSKQQINQSTDHIGLKKEENEIELNNSETACDMLATTISCVMLMASKVPTISDEHLLWAEHYLSHIKDKNGDYPPNVQGILNHINYVRLAKAAPESPTPNNKLKGPCASDRNCTNSPQHSDKKKPTSGMKLRNASASENNNKKRVCGSSCSTFTPLRNPIQKSK